MEDAGVPTGNQRHYETIKHYESLYMVKQQCLPADFIIHLSVRSIIDQLSHSIGRILFSIINHFCSPKVHKIAMNHHCPMN